MPTYEYRCDGCHHRFDHFQSMTARRLRKCPRCGTPKLRRLIGAGGGILFKGSGFYATDYRSDAYKKAAKSDSPAASSSGEDGASKPASGAKDSAKPSSAAPGRASADRGSPSKKKD